MDTILEPGKETPVIYASDVCVVGGSCTGVFAAVRAARLGCSVALIENNGFFGGTATAGLINVWHSLDDMLQERRIIGGLTQTVIERLSERNAIIFDPSDSLSAYTLNTEELKLELDKLVLEHGIHPFLHTRFVSAIVENGKVAAVIVEDKTGRRAIRARYFIDATGDGDLVARLGIPFDKRSNLQPATTVAIVEHYAEVLKQNPDLNLTDVVHNPNFPNALKNGFLWSAELPGRPDALMIAGTRAHQSDCSDADQLTTAEIVCRRQVRDMLDILRQHVAGGEQVVLSNLSSTLGIRETRHPKCLHQITGDELLSGTRFPDAIANGTYCVDLHHDAKPGITMRFLDGRMKHSQPGQPTQWGRWRSETEGVTPFYQIPYRALIPINTDNVLVAGRLIGADCEAYGAIRVMVNCNQTGEAAGVACALASNSNCNLPDVNVATLRERLQAGCSIVI